MVRSVEKKAEDLNADLQEQMAILRDDIATIKETFAEYGRTQGAHLRAVASEKVNEAAARSAATADELKSTATKAYADTEDAVRANPAGAIGIAAGLGFLVGMLMSRRN